MIRKVAGSALLAVLLISAAVAHGQGVTWSRSGAAARPASRLFHSTQAVSLPTAETLGKGIFQFEISHRFLDRFSDGYDAFYGLDGPVIMRLGLGYAPVDQLAVTLARSNLSGNVDLQGKYRLIRWRHAPLPADVAVQGGIAWNTQKREDRARGNSRNFQYYAQAILNTTIHRRLALGAVPSYLHNSDVDSPEITDLLAVGLYGQFYLNRILSVLAEWTPQVSGRSATAHPPAAFGIELETGGHFFKIVATNSTSLNPSQYLAGSEHSFSAREWRLGFLITRLLRT